MAGEVDVIIIKSGEATYLLNADGTTFAGLRVALYDCDTRQTDMLFSESDQAAALAFRERAGVAIRRAVTALDAARPKAVEPSDPPTNVIPASEMARARLRKAARNSVDSLPRENNSILGGRTTVVINNDRDCVAIDSDHLEPLTAAALEKLIAERASDIETARIEDLIEMFEGCLFNLALDHIVTNPRAASQ